MKTFRVRAHGLLCAILLLTCASAASGQNTSETNKPGDSSPPGNTSTAGKPTLPAPGGGAHPPLNQDAIDNLSHKHAGYYGALAPQNLAKKRAKPPFDLTGTW